MKQLIVLAAVLSFCTAAFAQSEKYLAAMKKNVAQLDSAHTLPTFQALANTFERIGDAEKTQWLPYYYAAYCETMGAYFDKNNGDAMAQKAEELVSKAEGLDKPNSETSVIRSMIASAHLMVDPQNRWQQYGKESDGYIAKAIAQDSTNPRPVYLQAQAKFYTPEAFGGGKKAAKPLFEKALAKFTAFQPASDIAPRWGKATAEYFLSQCN